MFLKRLETVGFKSFAERIQMDFMPGVTAVVGPNGSGKSNIIDAIRWVLGEQSAKSLRGQKMEDIIFQGSDSRKRLNFAEVSLVLNNEFGQLPIDYQEVKVTRRVYRSGESEFLINKQPCRLKDIIDLFMDTGLGREAFSIIGQGRIDEILSSKAEERRAVFEEAAGVLKYKQRKIKAEYKLADTEDNLERVEDIIHEIKQQMDPLEEQKNIAEQYQEKKQSLKQIEVALLVTEIELLHEEWQTLLDEIKNDKDIEMKQRAEIQSIDVKVEENKQAIQGLDELISQHQNKLLQLTELVEQAEGKRNVWKERSKHLKENKQKVEQEQIENKLNMKEAANALQIEKNKLQSVMHEIETNQANMKHLRIALSSNLVEIQADIENKKADYIEFLNKRAVLQNNSQSMKKEMTERKYKEQKETVTYQRLEQAQEEWLLKKEQSIKWVTKKTDILTNKETNLTALKNKLEQEQKSYQHMQQKLYEGNEHIAKLTSRKEMLVEMRDTFQGYYFGVKEILRARKKGILPAIEGTVVDVLDVPVTYTTAIDTVLGAQSQFIIVEDDQAATKTIEWLKRENKGRATFLPLQSISGKQFPDSLKKQIKYEKGFIGIAADLIHTSNRYDIVCQHLLGNVIVVSNIEAASRIAKWTNRRYRIVTLEGDMVYPGGSMSGGAKKQQNQSLFTREKELQVLTDKIMEYTVKAEEFAKNIAEKELAVRELESMKTNIELAVETVKGELHQYEEKHHQILISYRTAVNELNTYQRSKEEQEYATLQLEKQFKQNEKEQQQLSETISSMKKSIEDLEQQEKQFQTDKQSTEKELHGLEIKQAELEERKRGYEQQTSVLQKQLKEYRQQENDLNEQIKQMMDQEQVVQKKRELEASYENYLHERKNISQLLEAKRFERTILHQKTADDEKEAKGLYLELDAFTKKIQEKEVHANRLDVALENKLTTLQKDYTMTFERAAEIYDRVSDIENARKQVAVIKSAIRHLGTVNLGAIDEFKRLEERNRFLLDQQTDLLKAKATLREVIKEMDEELTTQFSTVFSSIQTAFTRVFEQLFGGGYAALQLTDPKDMLHTGIDIIARPPGKKLKTLGLLSGGERSLTAIALLFAILEVRPVPFCILDEVDAALDVANVSRFGTYLQSFSEKTQFIVITHRKGTMEEADVLYGITMQESGVSRLVSVKLEDTNELVSAT